MKNFIKLPIALLAGITVGCSTTASCPFDTFGEDCERITITAYLPPVVSDLDYKDIQGSQNQVIVPSGYQYALSIPGQEKAVEQAVTPPLQSFPLSTIPTNAIPETESVLFEYDRSTLAAEETLKLDSLIHRIEGANPMHVRVEGHTDSKGSAKYNKNLSIKRAQAARNYLVQHGIQPSRISIKGFGEDLPLVPNDTEEHRAKNRRADLISMTGN
jgi:outer membrane protein OmpA-like peptidoglycan-associated protein